MEHFEQIKKRLRERDLKTLLAMSLDNATYLIGAMIPSHPTSKKRRVIAAILVDREPLLILTGMEETFARHKSDIKDIRVYKEYSEDPIDFLGRTLGELDLSGQAIGVEMEGINAKDFLKLQEYASKQKFKIEDVSGLLEEIRMIKTSDEIATLREVCSISEDTISEVFSVLRPGLSEKEVETKFAQVLSDKGGDLKKARFGSGENTGVGNPVPGARKLVKGDLLRVDFMGMLSNYYSDIARTCVLGKPSPQYSEIWSKLMETHAKVLSHVRPGVRAKDLYGVYKKDFEKWGFSPAPMVGHGIGLLINEPPVLNAFNDTELVAKMVLCVEEYHIVKGQLGLHIEDTIVVTKNGYEMFSNKMDTRCLMVVSC